MGERQGPELVRFTPTEVKMGLHTRPIFAEQVASTAGNHDGLGAVDGINWLPGQGSNLRHGGYKGPSVSRGLGLSHHPLGLDRKEGVGRFIGLIGGGPHPLVSARSRLL